MGWQDVTVVGQICHWWQDLAHRRLSAMTILFALAAVLVLLGVTARLFFLVDGPDWHLHVRRRAA